MEDISEQKLSDAFENSELDGCIELIVKMININFGHNMELLERCKTLYGYSYFVSKIRQYKKHMPAETAVITVIYECIAEGITMGISESIVELLEEKGIVPEALRNTVYDESDVNVLRKWRKLSVKVESIDDFLKKMNAV